MSAVSAGPLAINHFPHVDSLGLLATLLYSNLRWVARHCADGESQANHLVFCAPALGWSGIRSLRLEK